MSDAETNEELSDVALCYQAMGLTIDASPEEIEQTYRRLTEGFRKELTAADPAAREQARVGMAQVNELYNKIKSSITYAAKVRDYEKQAAIGKSGAVRDERSAADPKLRKARLMQCPSCHGYISQGLKSCPFCKKPIRSKTETALRGVFTPLNVVILCLILIVGAIAVAVTLYPELLRALTGRLSGGAGK